MFPYRDDFNKINKRESVVFAGSFNPPTIGHLAILKYLSHKYGKVIYIIGINPNKVYDTESFYRAELLKRMSRGLPNVEVKVVKGYVWRFGLSQNATQLIRGIRSWNVDGKEEIRLHLQNIIGPIILSPSMLPIATMYVESSPTNQCISSTLVRDKCVKKKNKFSENIDISAFVPRDICRIIKDFYL